MPWLAQAGLFIVFIDFYWAGAARALGVSQESAFWLGSSRAGIAIEPLMVLSGLTALAFGALLVLLFVDNPFIAAAVVGVSVIDGWILLRSWPMWGIAQFFEGKVVWSPAAGAGTWSGPGLAGARRLTAERGIWNRHARRFAAVLVPLVAIVSLLHYLDWQWLADLVLYAVGLPLLAVVVVYGTGRLLQECNIDTDHSL